MSRRKFLRPLSVLLWVGALLLYPLAGPAGEASPAVEGSPILPPHTAEESSPQQESPPSQECAPVAEAGFTWQPTPTVGLPLTFSASAWATATVWLTETVDVVSPWPTVVSLALDAAGHPHIAYCDYNLEDLSPLTELKYAYYNGEVWEIQSLGDAGSEMAPIICAPSLVLDEQDYPHLAYGTYFRPDGVAYLKDMWYDGAFWGWEVVDQGIGDIGGQASLALDAEGHPHIGYYRGFYGESNGSLNYALYNGNEWITQTVDDNGDAGYALSLALDTGGHPHLAYLRSDPSTTTVRYAYYDGTSWISLTVPVSGAGKSDVSLVLDSSDLPHIFLTGCS